LPVPGFTFTIADAKNMDRGNSDPGHEINTITELIASPAFLDSKWKRLSIHHRRKRAQSGNSENTHFLETVKGKLFQTCQAETWNGM